MVRRHQQIIICFPCAALCNNPLNDKTVLLMLCTPHFPALVGDPHKETWLAVAIKHFQPGAWAWAGARVWAGCKLKTPVTFDMMAAFLKLFRRPVILFSLSDHLGLPHCYKWAGRGRGGARPTKWWSSQDLRLELHERLTRIADTNKLVENRPLFSTFWAGK